MYLCIDHGVNTSLGYEWPVVNVRQGQIYSPKACLRGTFWRWNLQSQFFFSFSPTVNKLNMLDSCHPRLGFGPSARAHSKVPFTAIKMEQYRTAESIKKPCYCLHKHINFKDVASLAYPNKHSWRLCSGISPCCSEKQIRANGETTRERMNLGRAIQTRRANTDGRMLQEIVLRGAGGVERR